MVLCRCLELRKTLVHGRPVTGPSRRHSSWHNGTCPPVVELRSRAAWFYIKLAPQHIILSAQNEQL